MLLIDQAGMSFNAFICFICCQASNAYLQFLQGPGTKMLFEFVKEMPKPVTNVVSMPDLSSLIGPLFFTWIILLLFPVSKIDYVHPYSLHGFLLINLAYLISQLFNGVCRLC